MNRSAAVKIILLEIIDFQKLAPGEVKWKHEVGTQFVVIDGQRREMHAQLFQAFQFGFGRDTMDCQASVILSLQQNTQTKMHFSHSKLADSNHTYAIKIDSIDDDFRVVDRLQYIDEFVQLKVYVPTMSFMFGYDLQNVLPTNDHDLRWHLEKNLMNKPELLNDYTENNANLQAFFEQKKSIASTTKIVNKIKKCIEFENENQRQKFEAATGERDLNLLHIFSHYKRVEALSKNEKDLRDAVAVALNVKNEDVIDQLKNWDAKMDEYGVRQLTYDASEGFNLSNQWGKAFESQQAKAQSLRFLNHALPSMLDDRFRMNYPQTERKNIDLEIELEDARVNLKQAIIEKGTSDVFDRWEARSHQAGVGNFEKLRGIDLIGIETIDSDPMVVQEKLLKREFYEKYNGEDYDAEPHTFRIPTLNSRDGVRPYLDRISLEGNFIVKTPDMKTFQSISALLKTKQYKLKTLIGCDKNDKRPYDKLPLQTNVEAKKVLSSINPVSMDPGTSKIRELTEKLEEKEYIIGKKLEDINNDQTKNAEILTHEESLERLEHKQTAQYLTDYVDLFQQIPTVDTSDSKSVINLVKKWNQYHNVVKSDPEILQTIINDMEEQLVVLKGKEQQLNELEQQKRALGIYFHSLKNEGEEIVDNVEKFASKQFGPSTVSANTALSNSYRLTIDTMKAQLTKWNYPFDPAQETSARAYYDCVSPQNKPTLESDEWVDIKPVVASKMDEIENGLSVLHTKDHHLAGTTHEMAALANRLQRKQKEKANQMVLVNSTSKNRNENFAPKFLEVKRLFDKLVQYCQPKWGVFLALLAESDDSPLDQPIRLLVNDPLLDRALTNTMTLNHHVAALILNLAINVAIGSPFIIIDGLDYFIEPCLIGPIMQLLKGLVQDYGIQTIFMKVKSEKEKSATSKLHSWYNEKNFEQIVETSNIVLSDDELQIMNSSLATIQSSSSSIY